MKIKTSRNNEYVVSFIDGPTLKTGSVILEMEDERPLSAVAADFEGLDWIQRFSEEQGDKRFEGFSVLRRIQRDGSTVQITLQRP